MPGAAAGIDLDAVVAIDVHTHAEISAITGRGSLAPELERAADEYFGIRDRRRPTVEEMAAYYRERKMVAVVFTVDATTSMGVPPVPNDEIAAAAHAHPDVLIPFGSVDPHLGRAAVREVHRLVAEHQGRQGVVRVGLPDDHPRPLAGRLRGAGHQARGAAEDPQAQRSPAPRVERGLTGQ
jgi:uncharacterized protein